MIIPIPLKWKLVSFKRHSCSLHLYYMSWLCPPLGYWSTRRTWINTQVKSLWKVSGVNAHRCWVCWWSDPIFWYNPCGNSTFTLNFSIGLYLNEKNRMYECKLSRPNSHEFGTSHQQPNTLKFVLLRLNQPWNTSKSSGSPVFQITWREASSGPLSESVLLYGSST